MPQVNFPMYTPVVIVPGTQVCTVHTNLRTVVLGPKLRAEVPDSLYLRKQSTRGWLTSENVLSGCLRCQSGPIAQLYTNDYLRICRACVCCGVPHARSIRSSMSIPEIDRMQDSTVLSAAQTTCSLCTQEEGNTLRRSLSNFSYSTVVNNTERLLWEGCTCGENFLFRCCCTPYVHTWLVGPCLHVARNLPSVPLRDEFIKSLHTNVTG